MIVFAVIITALSPIFKTAVAGWEERDLRIEILQNGRVALEEISARIKEATVFTVAEDDNMLFDDLNGDENGFRLQGNILQERKEGGSWEELANPIESVAFTYYDEGYDVTSVLADIRLVEITLVVSDVDGKIDPVTFRSNVMVRKDHLGF